MSHDNRCDQPEISRRWRRLGAGATWSCDCGKQYRLHEYRSYGDTAWEWTRVWPLPSQTAGLGTLRVTGEGIKPEPIKVELSADYIAKAEADGEIIRDQAQEIEHLRKEIETAKRDEFNRFRQSVEMTKEINSLTHQLEVRRDSINSLRVQRDQLLVAIDTLHKRIGDLERHHNPDGLDAV